MFLVALLQAPHNLDVSIFRKQTTTNTTINYLSNHPLEHKMAAYCFLIERMLTFPLGEKQQQKEWETIQQIAHNNNFPKNLLMKLKQHIMRTLTQQHPPQRRMTQNGHFSPTYHHTLERLPTS
jgi:hypothetical protein